MGPGIQDVALNNTFLQSILVDYNASLVLSQLLFQVQARKVVKPEATEEVVYDNEGEGEYEYDAEDDTSYYDDNEDDKKGTVKRTAILSQDVKNKTGRERLRRRRAVPVLEERYVPSTKNLWDVINSRNKSEGLRIYATYFNSPRSRVGPLAKVHQSKYR